MTKQPHPFLIWLLTLTMTACQPGLVSPTPSVNPSATASTSARVLKITSETNEPKLPKILVPGLELKVFAGSGKAGYKDGPALEAEFGSLGYMTQDEQGNFYITDNKNIRVRKLDKKGLVSTLAGTGKRVYMGKAGDFNSTAFDRIGSLNFKSPDLLFVSGWDSVYELNLSTQQSRLFLASAHRINTEFLKHLDQTETLPIAFIDDHTAFRIFDNTIFISIKPEIWKITETQGRYTIQRYAGNQLVDPTGGSIDDPARNFKDGPSDDSKFNAPMDFVLDRQGNMYVADAGNHRIRKVEVGTRNVSTLTGYGIPDPRTTIDQQFIGGFKDGSLSEALFNYPLDLVMTEAEDLLVTDKNNKGSIRMISQEQVRTFISNCDCGIYKDKSTLYITDNKNLQIYTLDLSQLEKLKPKILK